MLVDESGARMNDKMRCMQVRLENDDGGGYGRNFNFTRSVSFQNFFDAETVTRVRYLDYGLFSCVDGYTPAILLVVIFLLRGSSRAI